MSTKTHKADESTRYKKLSKLLATLSLGGHPAMAQAVESIRTAISYDDIDLIRSALQRSLDTMRDITENAIEAELQRAHELMDLWAECQVDLSSATFELDNGQEGLDAMGKQIHGAFAKVTEKFIGLRETAELLSRGDEEVKRLKEFQQAVEEFQALRQRVLDNWPRKDHPLPPVDRAMIARAKAAIARDDEYSTIDDAISQLHK